MQKTHFRSKILIEDDAKSYRDMHILDSYHGVNFTIENYWIFLNNQNYVLYYLV